MKQFLLSRPPEEDSGGLAVRLSGEDYHYLARVRRMRPGDQFRARLPGGGAVLLRVRSARDGLLVADVVPGPADPPSDVVPGPDCGPGAASLGGPGLGGSGVVSPSDPGPADPRIILFQALPRGAKMDLIVRQAVEAGLEEIVPFQGGHSVSRVAEKGAGKMARWERIVREARQQSGSPRETRLHPPCGLEGLFSHWTRLQTRYGRLRGILLHPPGASAPDSLAPPPPEPGEISGGARLPLETGTFHGYLDNSPDAVVIAVGPEGGFARTECDRFLAAGFKPLSLGNTVLRCETAALYAIAAARVILLENQSWILKPR